MRCSVFLLAFILSCTQGVVGPDSSRMLSGSVLNTGRGVTYVSLTSPGLISDVTESVVRGRIKAVVEVRGGLFDLGEVLVASGDRLVAYSLRGGEVKAFGYTDAETFVSGGDIEMSSRVRGLGKRMAGGVLVGTIFGYVLESGVMTLVSKFTVDLYDAAMGTPTDPVWFEGSDGRFYQYTQGEITLLPGSDIGIGNPDPEPIMVNPPDGYTPPSTEPRCGDPVISVNPTRGGTGTLFNESGYCFTPGSEVWLVFDHVGSSPDTIRGKRAGSNGVMEHSYLVHSETRRGRWSYHAIDRSSGRKSNTVWFDVLPN